MKDHEKRFDESIKTVKRQATELSNAGRKFGSGIKHAWGTIDKVTSEQGLRLTQLIEDTSQELVKKHTKSTYQEAETFHEESVAASNKIILAVRRYVPKIHRTLKSEISTLNSSLLKLEESINSLGKSLDQSPGSKLNPLDREITLITQAHELLNKTRSQKEQTNKQIENATNEENTLIQQKESLLTHPKFQELNLTQTQATAKRKEMDQLTQPLIKPLLKLERAMTNQETPLVDGTVLRNFIDDPVQSILTVPPSTNLKVLRALEIELNQGSLDIDERKRKRTEDSVTEVAESIEPFRATILQLQEATKRTEQELHMSGLHAKLSHLDALLDNKRAELQTLRTEQNDNDRKIDELTRTIAKHKSSIESQILGLSKEQVSIDVT